jgi:spectinomycin phosphotransferase
MREPPKLSNSQIHKLLQNHYGIEAAELTFLPIGNDAASFVYRVVDHYRGRFFLKVRTKPSFSEPSIAIPRFLHAQGIQQIMAALPTKTQAGWVEASGFVVTVYPFVKADTATKVGLSDQQWQTLGATLRQIHDCPLPAELQSMLPREAFVPSRRAILTQLETLIANDTSVDSTQRELVRFWQRRATEIQTLLAHTDRLGAALRQEALPMVLCHADFHTWNILCSHNRELWIVDWDETMLAPKERDLMFVIRGIAAGLVSAQHTTSFLQGYGAATINQRALTYYRYAWALQDMAAYAEDVFFAPDLSDQARRSSVAAFIGLFEPGQIVAIADESDEE